MRARTNGIVQFDREEISDSERALIARDIMGVAAEYFETNGAADLVITRTSDGLSVSVLFKARRIKKVRSPQ